MAYEQRDNSGTLFRNERRQNDRSPEYTGSVLIGGKEYWINGWVKEGKNEKKFFSLAFKEKESRPEQQSKPKQAEPLDDDVPF